MSRTLLHDWEGSVEKNKNNTEELLKIAEDIYNTAYIRGKASTERQIGEWVYDTEHSITIDMYKCSVCGYYGHTHFNFCPNCGCDMRKPNCVTCDHFGDCDGCEKGDEE